MPSLVSARAEGSNALQGSTSEKISKTQRARRQALKLLSHLEKTGNLHSGPYYNLAQIYNSKIEIHDVEIPFFLMFYQLLNLKLILRRKNPNNHSVAFDIPRVKNVLTKFELPILIDDLATLSIEAGQQQTNSQDSKQNVLPTKQAKKPDHTQNVPQAPKLNGSHVQRQIKKLTVNGTSTQVKMEVKQNGTHSNLAQKPAHLQNLSQAPKQSHVQNQVRKLMGNSVNQPVQKQMGSPVKQVKVEVGENGFPVQQVNSIPREVKKEMLSPQTVKVQSPETSSISLTPEPNSYPDNQEQRKRSKPKEPLIILDQKYGFKLHEISKAPNGKRGDVYPFSCQVCTKQFENNKQVQEHLETDEHLFFETYQNCRPDNSTNKKPPESLSGANLGLLVQTTENEEGCAALQVNLLQEENQNQVSKDIQLVVTYNPQTNSKPLYLDRTFILLGNPSAHIVEANAQRQTVRKGKQIKRNVKIQESEVGSSDYIVVFKFLRQIDSFRFDQPIFVMKQICVRVDNLVTMENGVEVTTLPSVKRYENSPPNDQSFITVMPEIVEEAVQPPKPKEKLVLVRALKNYDLPDNYKRFFNYGFEDGANIPPRMMQEKLDVLEILVSGLREESYSQYLAMLLYLEEHQTLCDLKMYCMKNAPLKKAKSSQSQVTLDVPGLAENRPSVLKGDGIYFSVREGQHYRTYKGWVNRVCNTSLTVGMGKIFMRKFIDNMKVTVHFSFNRMCLKMEHRALELMQSTEQVPAVCFPQTFGGYAKQKPIKSWFNKLVKGNQQQAQAVQNIVSGTSLPSPYLLFGPPGTGKTVTVVETIKQIFFGASNTYILATAPSNSASDLLAERLLQSVPPSKLIRLYSPSREWANVPDVLQSIANFCDRECYFPSLTELKSYRIIVATLICAGRLVSGGFPAGHFTHIFVDECGHGMEPTSLVPVAGLLGHQPHPGQLVLSGDPKQLGPIIRSPVAKRLGLAESLLERLMTSNQLYQKQSDGTYIPQVLTKLVKNFRSHPHILKVPNELFYDGDLVPCGDEGVTHLACNWEELPRKNVPLIFHGVVGKDEQDQDSPSFFNIAEVDLVVKYVKKVLESKFCGRKMKAADIGIISPYRRQIDKLHRALERSKLRGLSVGSVEEFQGQERTVIIVSTVRSNPAKLALDRKFRLGFLREPKRFNVAMTRAKSLLIVIGNPHILQQDSNWRSLLEWAIELGGFTGCPDFKLNPQSLHAQDMDELRVPVRKKLEKQRDLTKELLSKDEEQWNQSLMHQHKLDTEVTTLLDKIKTFNFFSEIPTVSDLEQEVSPPFNTSEQ